jgi:DHA1 family multidrug resistance protein-like MFS transporter
MGFFAGFTPMAMALATVSAPRERTSVAIARVQGAQLLSVAVGPAVGGVVASHLGIRPAFFVTAGMCVIALIALIFLFKETRTLDGGPARARTRPTPLREFLRYPHFVPVMVLLLVTQFIDRGLSLLIPLQVAHMPGVEAAATAGLIISVAAVGATLSAGAAARLAQILPVGQLLLGQLIVGGAFCAVMALAETRVPLLILRLVVALCLGGALTLSYTLGGMIVPAETRGAAFGWLALGVQIGTAASPLLNGWVAASSLPRAYLMNAVLAWAGAAVLVCFSRELTRIKGT